MKEIVNVTDNLSILVRSSRRQKELELEAKVARDPSPTIEGHFSLVTREGGKKVYNGERSGKNIWTLTGREFIAQVMSYAAYGNDPHNSGNLNPDIAARDDRIRYVGMGTGTTPEVSSVAALVSPTAFQAGEFLAQVAIASYPLTAVANGLRTTVRYSRTFAETELSISGSVIITEAGLFTDGSPAANYAPRSRDVTLAASSGQAPVAYKTFDGLKKTTSFTIDLLWDVRM
jgi:hypothetical protein